MATPFIRDASIKAKTDREMIKLDTKQQKEENNSKQLLIKQ